LRNRFPLIEWDLCRCRCEAIALESGYPVPRKSACTFCPYGSRCDWQTFAAEVPEDFAKVVKLEADKPLTVKNGEKIAIMGFGKKRVDGTRNIQLLDEWVTKPGKPRPPKPCAVCGAPVRATKATASDWLTPGVGLRGDVAAFRVWLAEHKPALLPLVSKAVKAGVFKRLAYRIRGAA